MHVTTVTVCLGLSTAKILNSILCLNTSCKRQVTQRHKTSLHHVTVFKQEEKISGCKSNTIQAKIMQTPYLHGFTSLTENAYF